MKYKKYVNIFILVCLPVIIFSQSSSGQNDSNNNDAKKYAIKNMIDSQHFNFVAQSVSPVRGGFRNLTGLYDVSISKDTMVSDLPYFGRAYSAPIDPSAAGFNFTSSSFSYSVEPYKKDGWHVTVKPKDNTDVQQFLFTIYDNGTASLNVTSISRDPISFNGYVEKVKKKKKK